MAHVWTEEEERERRNDGTLAERLRDLEKEVALKRKAFESQAKTKQFKFPFKWRFNFRKSTKKRYNDMILVFFLNKKGIIEAPKFMPVFDGNMIVYKNKP